MLGALCACPTPARAAESCPTSEALHAAILQVLPAGTDTAGVLLSDLGARYRVSVLHSQREFLDPSRNCDERARAAAVFVALVLAPPTISLDPAPPPPALPPGPVVPPVWLSPRQRGLHVDMQVDGLLDLSPSGGQVLLAGGAALRVAVGGRYLGGVLGVGGLSPVNLDLSAGRARLLRLPVDLSLRGGLRRGRIELSADLGLTLAVLVLSGLDLGTTEPIAQTTRLDPGLHLAAMLRVWATGHIAPFISFRATVSPRPYHLLVDPVGEVGTTSPLWLTAGLGLLFRVR